MYARKQLSSFHLIILVGFALLTGGSLYAQCPSLKAILVDPCNDDVNNEFIIIHSGSGFNTRDLQIDFDASNNILVKENNDINVSIDNLSTDPRPCRFQPGNANLVQGCPNIRVVSQDEEIPPNAVVIIQMSGGANEAYDFGFLCGSGECVYVLQNDCIRTAEAFRNKGTGTQSLQIALRGTACSETSTYNRALLDKGNGDFYAPDGTSLYGNRGCLGTPPAPPVGGAIIPPDFVDPGSLSGCPNVTLPAITGSNLTGGELYYTGPGGTGNTYTAGSKITRNLTLFMFDRTAPCSPEIPLRVSIIEPITPNLVVPTPVCEGDGAFPLNTIQDNIPGNWSGPGVVNNVYNPAINHQGIYTLTFTPNAGECALPNTTMLEVLPLPEATPGLNAGSCGSSGLTGEFDLTALADQIRNGIPGRVLWFKEATLNTQILDTLSYITTPGTVFAVLDNGLCPSNPVSVTLNVGPPLEIDISVRNLSCADDEDGSIQLNIAGGTPPYNIVWSDPAYNGLSTISNLGPGKYSVTVTDLGGCQVIRSTTLISPDPIIFSCSTVSDATTVGGQDGITEFSISGGFPPYTVIWFGPVIDSMRLTTAATVNLENLGAGIYDVLVRDAFGCTANCQFNIDAPNCGLTVTSTFENPSCADLDNGSITLTTTGGQGVINYNWNPNSLNGLSSAVNLPAGLYEVTVSDGIGCSRVLSFNLQAPPPLDLACEASINPSVQGADDGQARIGITGGTAPYAIQWAGPKSGSLNTGNAGELFIDNLSSGSYSLTVTDANDCEQFCSFVLPAGTCPNQLETAISHETCPGSADGSISLTLAGTWVTPVVIDWNNNQYDGQMNLKNLSPGNYSVTVTGANSCAAIANFKIEAGTGLPDVSFPANVEVCTDNCFTYPLSFSGTPPFFAEFVVRTGQQSTLINVESTQLDGTLSICPGDYGVDTGTLLLQLLRISDANCINDQPKESVITMLPAVETFLSPTLCFGESMEINGRIYDANRPSGTEILSSAGQLGCDSILYIDLKFYPQSAGQISRTLCPGESIVVNGQQYDENRPSGTEVMLNSNGCDSTIVIDLTYYPAAIGQLDTTLCPGEALIVNGHTYNAQKLSGSEIFPGAAANGCDSILEVSLSYYPEAIGLLTQTICPGEQITINGNVYDQAHPSGTEVLPGQAQNGCDSILNIQISFFAIPTTILRDTICRSDSLLVNGNVYDIDHPTGIETLAGQSGNGCDSILQIELSFFDNPITVFRDTICISDSLLINGNVYNIDHPNGIEVLQGQSGNGCDSIVQVELSFFETPISMVRDTLCRSGSLTVNGTVYDINRPTGVERISGVTSNGCDSLVQVELFFLEDITVSISGDASICALDSAVLEFQISNAPGPIDLAYLGSSDTLIWLYGVQDGDKIVVKPMKTTIYSIQEAITPPEYCNVQILNTATITVHPLFVDAVVSSDYDGYGISCNNQRDGAISIKVMIGEGPFQYHWQDGFTGSERMNLPPGVYSITVTDALGCATEVSANLEAPPEVEFEISTLSIDCNGGASGAIIIEDITGGNSYYNYKLNDLAPQPIDQFPYTIKGLAPGKYTLTVSDEFGCSATREAVVAEFAPLELELGPDKFIKYGESVRLDAEANFPIDSLIWSSTDASPPANKLPVMVSPSETTTYTLTAYDERGCFIVDRITIFVSRKGSVYLPSAFSPNHDGLNDRYYPFTDSNIKQIMEFRIFDRWGNQMHEAFNFQGNSEAFGWDGMFKNQLMDPAVFIYYMKAEYLDGKIEKFKGDFTLVR